MKKQEALALLAVAVLFFAFRIKDLGTLPVWDWDEGVNLNVGWNLSFGRAVLFALVYPFVPHPPLFFLFGGFLVRFFGLGLFSLRFFVVLLGFCSLFFLFFLGCRLGGLRLGFLSALLFAVYPGSVYWGRMAYANHLLAVFWVSAFYFYLRGGKWVYLSSFLAGRALITEYTGVGVVASVLYLFYRERRRILPLAALLSFAPFAVFSAVMLLTQSRYFLADMEGSFSWHILGASGIFFSLLTILYYLVIRASKAKLGNMLNLWREIFVYDIEFILREKSRLLLKQNPVLIFAPFYVYLAYRYPLALSEELLFFGMDFFWLGLFGFLWIRGWRQASLSFFAPLFFIIFLIGRSDHMLIPLYPYFALGLALLLLELQKHVTGFITDLKPWRYTPYVVFLILFLPVLKLVYSDYASFVLGENMHKEIVSEYLVASEYVNNNTSPGDLVLGNSHMFRFISSRNYSILTEGLVMSGRPVLYYNQLIPPDRMVFNASYRRAKYMVLSPGVFEWLDNQSLSDVSAELAGWPVEFNSTVFMVYRNPALNDVSAVEDEPPPD